MPRLLTAALVAGLTVLVGAAGVARATTLDNVADALRSDFVYVDPDAERALTRERGRRGARRHPRAPTRPIYVAVLPASAADGAGGDPAEVARQLSRGGRPTRARTASSSATASGPAAASCRRAGRPSSPTDALDASGDDTTAVLVDFVELVGERPPAASRRRAGAASGDG